MFNKQSVKVIKHQKTNCSIIYLGNASTDTDPVNDLDLAYNFENRQMSVDSRFMNKTALIKNSNQRTRGEIKRYDFAKIFFSFFLYFNLLSLNI